MSLVKFNHYPSLFDHFAENALMDWSNRNYSNATLPSVNIKENEEAFQVEVAAPGLSKEDFKIELNFDTLTISSEKKSQNEEKEKHNYTRREFYYQSFSRSFTLPNTADSEKIQASYVDGILKIEIPKKEEAKPKPPKLIDIN